MTDISILDGMDLPMACSNDELETISRRLLLPKFEVSKFELRTETKDTGIDITIEIKKGGKYTNFRSLVQLKATERKDYNADGSISLQLETSNINYLLNGGVPAFYILYSRKHNLFFYEYLNEFVRGLIDKDPNWDNQKSHALRFSKELNDMGIEEIYQLSIQKGLLLYQINKKLIYNTVEIQQGDKILLDTNLNLTDDTEIRNHIEKFGITLINSGKWNEILEVHKRASQNVATTAKYNLVLGAANYYAGDLFAALSFLKIASKLKRELPDGQCNYLLYLDTSIKYYTGLLSSKEYENVMSSLEKDKHIHFYIKINKIREKLINSENSDEDYLEFEREIFSILNDPSATSNIKLMTNCEVILYRGFKINMDFVRTVALINLHESKNGPSKELRINYINEFLNAQKEWYEHLNNIKKEALIRRNNFAYNAAIVNEVKVSYELMVYSSFVKISQEIPELGKIEMPDKEPYLEKLLVKLKEAEVYNRLVGHYENIIAILCTKFEILHFIKHEDEYNAVMEEIENLVNNYELITYKTKIAELKQNGTTHESFKKWFEKIMRISWDN